MKFLHLILLGIFFLFLASPKAYAVSSNPIITWDKFTTQLGPADNMNPPTLGRAYLLVHIAQYDALLNANYQLPPKPQGESVAVGAAAEVLRYLFPTHTTEINQKETNEVTDQTGKTFGENIGKKIVDYAKTDGFNTPFNGVIPTGPCKWVGTNPASPMAGSWKVFIISSGTEFAPPPPYPCGSSQDLADVAEVLTVSQNLTQQQKDTANLYAENPSTTWNNFLNDRIISNSSSLLDSARYHVYLNIAEQDAFITVWKAKYMYWTARPDMRIPNFVSLLPMPHFPAYPSGHAAVSAAASIILGDLYPAEKQSFSDLADLDAMSRLFGGVHFRQDNNNSLVIGRVLGAKVLSEMKSTWPHPFIVPLTPPTAPTINFNNNFLPPKPPQIPQNNQLPPLPPNPPANIFNPPLPPNNNFQPPKPPDQPAGMNIQQFSFPQVNIRLRGR